MPFRYRLPVYTTRIGLPTGSKEAATDGWFYPVDASEELALVRAGCEANDLNNPAPVSGSGKQTLISAGMVSVGGIGDSIVRNNYSGLNSGGLAGWIRKSTGFGCWITYACALSGGRAYPDVYAYEGYSGNTGDQILAAALDASATETWGAASTIPIGIRARTPKVVFDMSGTNNLYLSTLANVTNGTSLQRAIAERRAIWAYLRACGALPIAMSLLPMQGSTAGTGGMTGAACAPYVPAWNTAMKAAADADSVPWVDGYTPCAASSGGGWKAGYVYHNGADDAIGLHPSALASLAIGAAAAQVLISAIAAAPALPRIYDGSSPIYSAAFVSGGNRQYFSNFSNPLFSSTTGWASRYDPDGDSSFGLYTPTQDVAGGGTLRFVKPSAATTRYADWRGPTLAVTAGQEYIVFADVRLKQCDALAATGFQIADDTSASASRYQPLAVTDISSREAPVGSVIDSGVMRMALYYKVPTSITAVCPMVVINRGVTGGSSGLQDEVYISNLGQLRLS